MNFANQSQQTTRVCADAHRVDGIIPQITDLYFDQRRCDCGKLFFYKEKCTCPSNPHFDLKSKPYEG